MQGTATATADRPTAADAPWPRRPEQPARSDARSTRSPARKSRRSPARWESTFFTGAQQECWDAGRAIRVTMTREIRLSVRWPHRTLISWARRRHSSGVHAALNPPKKGAPRAGATGEWRAPSKDAFQPHAGHRGFAAAARAAGCWADLATLPGPPARCAFVAWAGSGLDGERRPRAGAWRVKRRAGPYPGP